MLRQHTASSLFEVTEEGNYLFIHVLQSNTVLALLGPSPSQLQCTVLGNFQAK